MNEVNKTLFIPLYGKSLVSRKQILLKDPYAEKTWEAEKFPIRGKSGSKWLAYNMAMRARIFDDIPGHLFCTSDADSTAGAKGSKSILRSGSIVIFRM